MGVSASGSKGESSSG